MVESRSHAENRWNQIEMNISIHCQKETHYKEFRKKVKSSEGCYFFSAYRIVEVIGLGPWMKITFTTLNIGANGVCVGCPTSHNVWETTQFDVGRAKIEHMYLFSF